MKEIVVVDDNKMFLETLQDFVEGINKDFKCTAFLNPNEALQYVIDKKEIYAIVTDYEMPQMTGLALAGKITETFPEMKIIVMSGHDIDYLRKQALKVGISEYKFYFLCKSDMINLSVLLNL